MIMPLKGKNGSGYAGDQGDATQRKKLRKQAEQVEKQNVQIQKQVLNDGLKSLRNPESPPSDDLLKTMKSIIRNQANWSSVSSCQQYNAAVDCCESISNDYPKYLGKEDDDESVLSALKELASTAEMISQHADGYSPSVKSTAKRVVMVMDKATKASRNAIEETDLSVFDQHAHYRQSLRPIAFEFVNELPGHSFLNQTSSCVNSTQRQKILKELTTYKTALPVEYGSSIFIRVMESRMDLLRAMITGPSESPYACGCFLFDIYLNQYPSKPPKVQFLTTGGGQYRFNPNLYKDGKVCLSLLGTWQGPGWVSGESSLLQILVSIQSLILVDQPYFNEPGYESEMKTNTGKQSSKLYNANIRRYTLSAAILPYIQQNTLFPEFKTVIDKHFSLKLRTLKKELYQWFTESRDAVESDSKGSRVYVLNCQNCPSMEILYNIFFNHSGLHFVQKRKARKNTASTSIIEIHEDDEDDELQMVLMASASDQVIEIDTSAQSKKDNSKVIDLT